MIPIPFSQRIAQPPEVLTTEIKAKVRSRIINTFNYYCEQLGGDVPTVYHFIGLRCNMQHGGLYHNPDAIICSPRNAAEEVGDSFMGCPPDKFLDMIQWYLQTDASRGQQLYVDALNNIFRQEGVAYQFSDFIERRTPVDEDGGIQTSKVEIEYPQATRTTDHVVYQTTIQPALRLLSKKVFEAANKEMLQAHQHFKAGKWEDAITSAGRSFESVLKTICEKKKWTYDRNKHGLADLVKICKDKNLFAGFYGPIFEGSGTVRNKLGAHGQGPNPPHDPADEATAEHMMQMTSAHILLVARQAKM